MIVNRHTDRPHARRMLSVGASAPYFLVTQVDEVGLVEGVTLDGIAAVCRVQIAADPVRDGYGAGISHFD